MSDALTDASRGAKLVRGLRPTRVTLVDYDPAWPTRYAERADQLRSILGSRARLIEHIGSTAVPGLIAKPIIDIVIGIDDPDTEARYLPDLEAAGYDLRVREPGHRCLRAGEPDEPVNLHCYPPESTWVRRDLVFRNRLRTDSADRELYATTKRALTDQEWPDINYYAAAKGPVIEEILKRAGWQEYDDRAPPKPGTASESRARGGDILAAHPRAARPVVRGASRDRVACIPDHRPGGDEPAPRGNHRQVPACPGTTGERRAVSPGCLPTVRSSQSSWVSAQSTPTGWLPRRASEPIS